jgi:hypothetical protein
MFYRVTGYSIGNLTASDSCLGHVSKIRISIPEKYKKDTLSILSELV